MLGKEVLAVDLCSLSAKNVQLEVFRSSTFRACLVWTEITADIRFQAISIAKSFFFNGDSSYSRPSAKLAKQLGMPCGLRDNTESLTIYTRWSNSYFLRGVVLDGEGNWEAVRFLMIAGFMSMHLLTWHSNGISSSCIEVHRHSCANDVSFPDSYLQVYSPSPWS